MTTLPFSHHGALMYSGCGYALMRSVSILELCLLLFLCLSMNALQISGRDMAFGIALGFGLFSADDFILSPLLVRHTSRQRRCSFWRVADLLTLGIWIVYTALPEPERKPVVLLPTPPSIAGTK